MGEVSLNQAWAKTDPVTRAPVVWVLTHCLNVGAATRGIVERTSAAVRTLFPEATWRGLVCLAALHDIGKISPGFLQKCEAWTHETCPGGIVPRTWVRREKNHARVSHIVLGKCYGKSQQHAGYAVAAGAHHGRFTCGSNLLPNGSGPDAPGREINDPDFQAARQDLLTRLQREAIFGPLPQAPLSTQNDDATLVVFLTGLITLADWIGSDEGFFKLEDPTPDDETNTLARSTEQAKNALAVLHWGETTPVPQRSFAQLFPPFGMRPLQTRLAEMVHQGPGLYVVEAPMGVGKTEAALYAAYLRWTLGGERGLYFALPTQLTSDNIYRRVNRFLARAVSSPDVSTLVHGSAWLRAERAVEIHPASRGEDDRENAVDARQWFASGRRSLLAPFGAGTLDQALLSVLPAKHCGLRLFALAGKVVVCDEVHSYDPYTSRLLDALIKDLLLLRCTVIVLTATLPAARKTELLKAAGATVIPDGAGYPLITAVRTGSTVAEENALTPDRADERTIRLEHLPKDDPTIWERACGAAEAGACVLIIRNTVAAAQATFRAVRSARCGNRVAVALLHSRFPRWRRDKLEYSWLRRLGKPAENSRGRKPRPKGCVLVATQVVEQSVDIDADLLITDLAPTDPLFQRMGRLHRHRENVRPPGCEQAQAWILHPALTATMDAREIKEHLGASGKVYPPAVLFRTWQIWHGRPEVVLPGVIRELLDDTYAPLTDSAPAGLRALDDELQAHVDKRVSTAAVRLDRLNGGSKDDRDDGSLTRWIEQRTTALLLLRAKPEKLPNGDWKVVLLDGTPPLAANPYRWSLPVAQALHRNVVTVPAYTVRDWPMAPFLKDYFAGGGAVGVVEGEEIQPLEPLAEQGWRLTWNSDEGVELHRIKVPGRRPEQRDVPDDWQDFEDDPD